LLAAYGDVLAREYQDPALFRESHRLTVDAYTLQHPGDPADRRAVQSVWLHFASLDAILRCGRSHGGASALLQRLAGREFPRRPEQRRAWRLTASDIARASIASHPALAINWARETHAGWLALIDETVANDVSRYV
jgi:ABC-type taurine transport system ATPase subunit